jgi:diaminohydroxyphosphoribosylaminopyrimidine deaminase/5-amino-6-(5-phosphoribosylamino)uracil reductase
VVIAAENPERLSAGRGLERLRAAGVPVELGLLAEEAEPIYRAFRHRLRTGLPVVEVAASGEGFDGAFVLDGDETVEEALRRLAAAGYARLWVETGGALAVQLKNLGFLTKSCFPEP